MKKYFLFQLGDEIYGTPLSSLREVIEYREPKRVPHMADWFKGVINLRGEIVGVVDLRQKFGLTGRESQCIIVFATERGSIAGIIDRGLAVKEFADEDVETNPQVRLRINAKFLIGVGRHDHEMVVLSDLSALLNQEELVSIEKARKAI